MIALAREYERNLLRTRVSAMSSSLKIIEENFVNEEIEETHEKEIEETQKMIEETQKGNWTRITLPQGAQYVMIRAVMTLKKTDANGMKEIQLDLEGKHEMGYTPWKLIKETDESKVWIHDEAMIAKRDKKEALEAEEEKRRVKMPISKSKPQESLIKEKDWSTVTEGSVDDAKKKFGKIASKTRYSQI
jgi:hypothetical protein